MKVVYVAGPFRGASHWAVAENIRHAERLALEVWRLGAAAVCPHLNTAHFQDAAPDDVWLDGDLAILAKCDAVVLTDNWARSRGATTERAFAERRGIPVFESIEALAGWIASASPEQERHGDQTI